MGFWRDEVETPCIRDLQGQQELSVMWEMCQKVSAFVLKIPVVSAVTMWLLCLVREKLATEIFIFHSTLLRFSFDKTIFIKQKNNLFHRSSYLNAIFFFKMHNSFIL